MPIQIFGTDLSEAAIPRLKLKIDVSNLEQMMPDVIQQVHSKQQLVQDHDGHWCSLRITPYRTLDNRIDGVVLSVLDRSTFDEVFGSEISGEKTNSSAKRGPKTKSKKA
ncbi:PAS domain-containing protein [Paracidobacterium acidisoli]|nr:PAS domain-containing protein [Paracidobacterium acidisoli]MBT9332621.1 PAS domain-containing protein [Paracidobacterium acidisoli]